MPWPNGNPFWWGWYPLSSGLAGFLLLLRYTSAIHHEIPLHLHCPQEIFSITFWPRPKLIPRQDRALKRYLQGPSFQAWAKKHAHQLGSLLNKSVHWLKQGSVMVANCPWRWLAAELHGTLVFGACFQAASVQFSSSVVSDSLQPHELQNARPPCPSPSAWVYPDPCPLSQWGHPIISSSVVSFSCPQSFPASGSFQMSQLFTSGGQSIGVSASTSALPTNTQDWSPLGWTGWISLQSKGLSRVFSNTTVQNHEF